MTEESIDEFSDVGVVRLIACVVGIVQQHILRLHRGSQEEEEGKVEVVHAVRVIAHSIPIQGQVDAPLAVRVEVLPRDVRGDRGLHATHQTIEDPLLETDLLHATAEAVLLLDRSPYPSRGLAGIAGEALRVLQEIDVDAHVRERRVKLRPLIEGVAVLCLIELLEEVRRLLR